MNFAAQDNTQPNLSADLPAGQAGAGNTTTVPTPVSTTSSSPTPTKQLTTDTQVDNSAKNATAPTESGQASTKDGITDDVQYLEELVAKTTLPDTLKTEAQRMITRVKRVTQATGFSQEYELVRKYVEWITRLPWGKYTTDNFDLNNAKSVLDTTHHGLEKVKDRILEYLATMRIKQQKGEQVPRAPIFLFVGLQGIGKTTMAKAMAQALGRQFIRISLGAMGAITELRGVPKTEIDAEPGQIVKALVSTETFNPVILLDELDKASAKEGTRTDIMAALLEILDPEQNVAFRDHYLDYPIDLSKVMFVCTANNLGTISTALLDRLEVIRFFSYSDDEKTVIAKQYLLPRVFERTGLSSETIEFTDDAWPVIVRPLGYDAGVRQLERNIESICRKAAKLIVEGKIQKVVINAENVKQFIQESGVI